MEQITETEVDAADVQLMGLFASEELDGRKWELEGRSFAYWYDGVPGFAEEDFEQARGHERRTVLMETMFSEAPPTVTAENGVTWTLLRTYSAGAERECPGRGEVHEGDKECPICQAAPGEQHGHAYVGECWVEAVYQCDEEDE